MKQYKPLKLYEIVETFDVEPIEISNVAPYIFRIEVIKDCSLKNVFFSRVWRVETFRIKATFEKDSSDENILILDTAFEWKKIRGRTPNEVINKVYKHIVKTFDIKGKGAGS